MKLVLLGILVFIQSFLHSTVAIDDSSKAYSGKNYGSDYLQKSDIEYKPYYQRKTISNIAKEIIPDYKLSGYEETYAMPTIKNVYIPSNSRKYTKATKTTSTYSKSYNEYPQNDNVPSYSRTSSPKVDWVFWVSDITYNNNQQFAPRDFASIDCNLSPNIIHYDLRNVNFDKNLVFDWMDPSLGAKYLKDLHIVKNRCPRASVIIDPEFVWNKNLSDQIGVKFSIKQLVDSLLQFNLKYESDGIVITFGPEVVMDDRLTYDFLKELKYSFSANKMQVILTYGGRDFSYVRPVAFEFADLIIIYNEGYRDLKGTTLQHTSPLSAARSNIELFVNMGAPRSIISLILDINGFSFKRVTCKPETNAGCPADGLGSIIYTEDILEVKNKNVWPFLHDRVTICRLIDDPSWTKKFDDVAKLPYAYNSNQWISYENEQSIELKIDLVKEKEISGVSIFAPNFDDIDGECGKGSYPLIRFITDELQRSHYPRY